MENVVTLLVAVAALLWLGPSAEQAPWRVIVVYGGGAWVMLRVIMVAGRVSDEFGKAWTLLVLTPLVMLGAASSAVMVVQAMDMQHSLELHHFTSNNVRILFIFMFVAGAFNLSFFVLVTLRLVQRLRHQNERDPLTGLFNRRALEGALGREWHRFTRSGQAFSVLMVDIDLFKPVNDTHGHAVGDLVLKEVAERVRNASRTLDMAVRHGGEEFLVLMPLCDLDGAKVVAERVRRAVEENAFPCPGATGLPQGLVVTVSVGVATASESDGTGAMLVARADRALYAAKRAGRNCVRVSS